MAFSVYLEGKIIQWYHATQLSVLMPARLAANIGKIQPLQNTPYVEECCVEIEKQQEYLTDRYLVLQVRFQNIADNALRSFPFSSVDYWGELGTETVIMLVKSFERDLERFKNMLEPGLIQSSRCSLLIQPVFRQTFVAALVDINQHSSRFISRVYLFIIPRSLFARVP